MPYRYWRLYVTLTNAGGGMETNRVALRTAGVHQGGGTGTASSTYSGYNPDGVFDDPPTSSWADNFSGTYPQWLMYDFGAGNEKDIDEFIFQPVLSNRSPCDFRIEASNDGVLWGEALVVTGASTGWSSGVARSFALSAPVFPTPKGRVDQLPLLVTGEMTPGYRTNQLSALILTEIISPQRTDQLVVQVLGRPVLNRIYANITTQVPR